MLELVELPGEAGMLRVTGMSGIPLEGLVAGMPGMPLEGLWSVVVVLKELSVFCM